MTSSHAGASKKLDIVGELLPPKNGKACSVCHARKVKCDAIRPACTACRRSASYGGRDPDTICCVYHEPGVTVNTKRDGADQGLVLGTVEDGLFNPTTRLFDAHSLDEHRHHPCLSAPPAHPSRKRPSSPPPPPLHHDLSIPTESSTHAALPSGAVGSSASSHVSFPAFVQGTLPFDFLSLLEPPFLTLSRDLPRVTPAPEFDWGVFDRAWTWTRGRGTPSPSGSGSSTPLPTLSSSIDAPTKEWQRQVAQAADLAKRAPSLSSLRASSPAPSDVSNDSCASNESGETRDTVTTSTSGEDYTTICELEVVRRPNKRRRSTHEGLEKRSIARTLEPVEDVDLWMRIFDTMQH